MARLLWSWTRVPNLVPSYCTNIKITIPLGKKYMDQMLRLVQEEDAQPLTEPIIAPVKVRKWAIQEKYLPETRYDKGFLLNLLQFPSMAWNVAITGHLHHGKTSLLDMLVFETHRMTWDSDKAQP